MSRSENHTGYRSVSALAVQVALVGAGPGDPGLITVKGAEALRRADVVLYDALANPRLLDLAPAHAELLLVGKRHGKTSVAQEEVERLIVEHARAGKFVVRLKGGDPVLFGRGGEEAEACVAAGVSFEIIPGVTSALAVPAYAGVPVTHRKHASSVTILTGRPGVARAGLAYNWEALACSGDTLVFVMAVLSLPEIADKLIAAGMDGATPAVAVRWGTTPRQRTLRATLATLPEVARTARLRPPAVLVVGEVAALAESLSWYERLPLFGRRIVVTRPRHQAKKFADALELLGAEIIAYPTVDIAPPADPAPVVAVMDRIGSYDWLVLTSVNGVERFFEEFFAHGYDVRSLAGVRVAAIGPATADAIECRGIRVEAQPAEYRAEALLESLGDVAGKSVLLARAEVAREVLPDTLRERGARVDVVSLYCATLPKAEPLADAGGIDLLTFTSSSTVDNFVALNPGRGEDILATVPVAVIGPITARTLLGYGVEPALMPSSYTVPDLAAEIVRYFANRSAVK